MENDKKLALHITVNTILLGLLISVLSMCNIWFEHKREQRLYNVLSIMDNQTTNVEKYRREKERVYLDLILRGYTEVNMNVLRVERKYDEQVKRGAALEKYVRDKVGIFEHMFP